MSDNTQFIVGIGIIALIFGAFLFAMGLAAYYDEQEREKRGEPPRYDERQRIVRLRAGNRALAALVVYLVLWTICSQLGYAWAQSIWSMLFSALFLVWGVWSVDCVFHDGFIGWKEQKNTPDYLAMTVTWLLYPTAYNFKGISWMPLLFVSADVVVLGAVLLYKRRKEKRMAGEEDVL